MATITVVVGARLDLAAEDSVDGGHHYSVNAQSVTALLIGRVIVQTKRRRIR